MVGRIQKTGHLHPSVLRQPRTSLKTSIPLRSAPDYQQRTFAHITDAFLEDIVAVAVHMGAQEVLEAVVDLQPGSRHAHPLAN